MQTTAAPQVLEILTYRLAATVTPQAYLATVQATAPVLHAHPGLVSRSLTRHGDTWTEVIRWATQADADAAGQAIMADPAAEPLMAALDMASLTLLFAPILWHKGQLTPAAHPASLPPCAALTASST